MEGEKRSLISGEALRNNSNETSFYLCNDLDCGSAALRTFWNHKIISKIIQKVIHYPALFLTSHICPSVPNLKTAIFAPISRVRITHAFPSLSNEFDNTVTSNSNWTSELSRWFPDSLIIFILQRWTSYFIACTFLKKDRWAYIKFLSVTLAILLAQYLHDFSH